MNFWQGKKVLITGHTGFKGSWLSLLLQHLEAEVIGLSMPAPTNPSLFELANVERGIKSNITDIRNFSEVCEILQTYQPEFILHMAAQPLVRESYLRPIETYETNVLGTVYLLEAARQTSSVKTIVNITTDKCYENQEWFWPYREQDKLGGYDPYSNSKACSELVTHAYRCSYFNEAGIGLASARAGNVIGGGDWAKDRLIPDIINSCIKGKKVSIRYPQAIRPWQHVLEPLSGYLLLAQELNKNPKLFAEGWNFGPEADDIKSVAWIADEISKQWGSEAHWQKDNATHLHESKILMLDCSKAKHRLNWKPKWNLDRALKETVEWYRAFNRLENVREITISQIIDYLNT